MLPSHSLERLVHKILYVLSPEKFLSGAVLGRDNGPGLSLSFLLLPLDCCALGALGVGLHNGDLPAPLAASYVATALAFFGFGAYVFIVLTATQLRKILKREEDYYD